MIRVLLQPHQATLAIDLARKSFAKFRNTPGHYNNRFNSHFKGRLGEIAVASYFDELDVKSKSLFLDSTQDKECDILIEEDVPMPRVEVKTWTIGNWSVMGRCIAIGQIAQLVKKADAIIWCIADLPNIKNPEDVLLDHPISIEIRGFSTIGDAELAPIRMTGPDYGRKVANHQVDEDKIRDIAGFLAKK